MTKVRLRENLLRDGKEKSLYLDFYPPIRSQQTGKLYRKEFLKIYTIVNPRSNEEKELNERKYFAANEIKVLREREIFNRQYGLLDPHNANKSFTEYFNKIAIQKKQQVWKSAFSHFKNYTGHEIKFGQINQELVDGFRNFLQTTTQRKTSKNPKKLASASASAYFNKFIELLKLAKKKNYITDEYSIENIKVLQNKRQFLNLEQIKKLETTNCDIDVLKRASLFSCKTGLRFGDIKKLQWKDIEYHEADKPFITIRQSKTGENVNLPLSEGIIELCGDKRDNNDFIFDGLAKKHIDAPLKKWLREAGIEKKITFHCFRHSFATILINSEFEIYAVQKLLGHKSINTTQIYTSLNAEKYREEIEKAFK